MFRFELLHLSLVVAVLLAMIHETTEPTKYTDTHAHYTNSASTSISIRTQFESRYGYEIRRGRRARCNGITTTMNDATMHLCHIFNPPTLPTSGAEQTVSFFDTLCSFAATNQTNQAPPCVREGMFVCGGSGGNGGRPRNGKGAQDTNLSVV